jgi:BASS family bile acid:Na+ symporter
VPTLARVFEIAVFCFVVSAVLAAALDLPVPAVLASLRRRRDVAAALAASFVVAPALGWLGAQAPGLDAPLGAGLLLVGTAGGAPFLPLLARLARADGALSVGLMVLLVAVTVVFMPLVLPHLLPGAHVTPWALARPLLVTMVAPLAAGLALRARAPLLAARLARPVRALQGVSLVATLVLLFVRFGSGLLALAGPAVPVAAAFVIASTAVGVALGGPDGSSRAVQGLAAGTRNAAAAFAVAVASFDDPGVLLMVVVVTLLNLLLLVPAAWLWGRRTRPREKRGRSPYSEKTAADPGGLEPRRFFF